MILFYHLSKTGGVSLLRAADRAIAGERKRVFLSEMRPWLDRLRSGAGAEAVDGVAFLSGHFAYGIHEYLPERPRTFTILRNPVDQTLSMYHTAMNAEGKRERIGVYPSGRLTDLLTTPAGQPFFNNPQVRHLAGTQGEPVLGEVTEAHLERAVQVVLDEMTAFGIAEYPVATIDAINAELATSFDVRFENVSPRAPSRGVSSDLLQVIWSANAFDRRLYERCVSAFVDRLVRVRPRVPVEPI